MPIITVPIADDRTPQLLGPSLFAQGTLVASDGALTVDNLKDYMVGTHWIFDTGVQTVDVTVPSAQTTNCCGVCGFTAGMTFQLQYWDGAMWVNIGLATAPTGTKFFWIEYDATQSDQWRMQVTAVADSSIISVMFLGTKLRTERGLTAGWTPIGYAAQKSIDNIVSDDGLLMARITRKQASPGTFSLKNLSEDWMTDNWLAIREHATEFPLMLRWCPEGRPAEIEYFWTEGRMLKNDAYNQPGFQDISWPIMRLDNDV